MAALILANTTTLRRLRVELQLLEQKQKRAVRETSRGGSTAAVNQGSTRNYIAAASVGGLNPEIAHLITAATKSLEFANRPKE